MYEYPEYSPELFEHGIRQYGDRPSPLGHFQYIYKDADEGGDDFDYEYLHSQLGYDENTKIPTKIRNNASSYKYVTSSPVFQKMAENFDEEAYKRMDGSNKAYERYLQNVLPMTEENFENKDMYDKYMVYLAEDAIESNPSAAAASLPEGSDIQKEAEEAIDGGADAEVKDNVVEDAIKNDVIDDDFFANYAKKNISGNGDLSPAEAYKPSVYSTPKIDRADHSGYRAGNVSKKDYRGQLQEQERQSNEALSKASQMMNDERARYENEGGQFNRGHIGAYSFPAGAAAATARKKLGMLSSDDTFDDIDAKYYSKHQPEIGEEYSDLTISDVTPEQKLEEVTEADPELVKEAAVDTNPIQEEAEQITDDDDARNDEVSNEAAKEAVKSDGIDWDKIEAAWEKEHNEALSPKEFKDEFGREVPDFVSNDEATSDEETAPIESEPIIDETTNDSSIFDPGLEDQNGYTDPVENVGNDITVYNDKMASSEPIPDEMLEPAPEAPYSDNVVQIKDEPIIENEPIAEEPVAEEEPIEEDTDDNTDFSIGGHNINLHGNSYFPQNDTKLDLNRASSAGSSFGNVFKILSAPGGSISPLRASSISKNSEAKTRPSPMSSRAGGGFMPIVPKGSSPVSIHAGRSGAVGFKNTSGNYSTGSVPKTASTLSMRSVASGYGGKATSSKGVALKANSNNVTLGGNKMSGDMMLDRFVDTIVKDSRTWKKPGDSGDKFKPYHIIVENGHILINDMSIKNAIKKHPECVQFILSKI